MKSEIIDVIIKSFIINLFTYITFFKINNYKKNMKKIIICCALQSILYTAIKINSNNNIFLIIVLSYFTQIILLKLITKDWKRSVSASILTANAIVYTLFIVSLMMEFMPKQIFNINNQTIDMVIALTIETILLIVILNMKRIKNGISFIKDPVGNEYLCIIMINISALVLFAYCVFGSTEDELDSNILIILLTLAFAMVIMIQKTLTLYYKQKLLIKNIEDYKSTIAEKDAQIKTLSDEKFKISKLNHEFYNRQKALELKVSRLSNMNTEAAGELDISRQIKSLTKEYSDKAKEIKKLDKLPSTDIAEIDDMFKYMQNECENNNIQFNLQVNGNIYHMINKKIPQNKLVTLIGDHIRDAIIAISSSDNSFKSILAFLGENDGIYEFSVYDTGIEFEIDTLLKLGLEPATTHKDNGGSGIGFMTTFETMKETKASLIINERQQITNNDYTKSVTIRFDEKNEYRIKSYRNEEIKKQAKDSRIIIEK